MNRREFVKGAALAFFGASIGRFAEARPLEYDKKVCNPIGKLVDYKTHEPFEQEGFILAYFATPYKLYNECDSDAIKMGSAILMAQMQNPNLSIEAALVFSPVEKGDPNPGFAKSYSKDGNGSFDFVTLTADKDIVLDVARDYRSAFHVDRVSGAVKGHSRSVVLIGPEGELLSKYSAADLNDMDSYIVKDCEEYNARRIGRAPRHCEPD